ncbi:MAG: recombinase family protein [Bacteroidales bacterium]|nr:recombinase family protein [Bacteroidales bacterium]
MVYAYIRVSTEVQSYESQMFEIRKWCEQRGMAADKWIKETISGTQSVEKRVLGRLLKRLRPGDTLICSELSRLGRNMMMVMSILNFCSQKGIRLYSIKDGFELSDNLNSKIIAFAFSFAAEIERTLISQRTREALAAKKAAGIKLGRPAGPSKQRRSFDAAFRDINRRLADGDSISTLARELKMHRNTLSKFLRENCAKKGQESAL